MFKAHPFPCGTSPFLHAYYPVVGGLDRLLEYYKDIHSFKIQLKGEYFVDQLTLFLQNQGQGGIISADVGVTAGEIEANAAQTFGSGETKRIITSTNFLPDKDEQPLPSFGPVSDTVCGEHPLFTFTSGSTSVIIDIGKSINLGGVFAPYVEITFSNDMTSKGGLYIVGAVNLEGYGDVPMYGHDQMGTAFGAISVKERYSDLAFSTYSVGRNGAVTVAPLQGKTFTGFKGLKEVWFGMWRQNFSVTPDGSSVTIQLNSNATSDYFTFITDDGNKFSLGHQLIVRA